MDQVFARWDGLSRAEGDPSAQEIDLDPVARRAHDLASLLLEAGAASGAGDFVGRADDLDHRHHEVMLAIDDLEMCLVDLILDERGEDDRLDFGRGYASDGEGRELLPGPDGDSQIGDDRAPAGVGLVRDVDAFFDPNVVLGTELPSQHLAGDGDDPVVDVGPEAGMLQKWIHAREG